MITQTYTNGDSEIKFENAESLEDAKANGFTEGSFTRFYKDGKPVHNYMALVRSIVEETQKSGNKFIPPTREALKKLQQEVMQKQNESIKAEYRKLQSIYKQNGASDIVLKQLDDMIDKIDLAGVRVSQ